MAWYKLTFPRSSVLENNFQLFYNDFLLTYEALLKIRPDQSVALFAPKSPYAGIEPTQDSFMFLPTEFEIYFKLILQKHGAVTSDPPDPSKVSCLWGNSNVLSPPTE
jgi:hypothetical protein